MYLEVTKNEAGADIQPVPILFVHGMWHAAWCWSEYFLPFFARQGYSSYALSLRGHGGSEGRKHLRWASLDDYVSDLVRVVGQFEKPPILIGHSMGGMVVQKYLESRPAAAAVLLASVPPAGVLASTARMFLRHPVLVTRAGLTLDMAVIIKTPELMREAFFSLDIPEKVLLKYHSLMQAESFRVYLDMLVFNLPKPRPLSLPLLVLGAQDDRMVSTGEVEVTARSYGVQAEIFSGMAHDMMLESGWKKVAERILDWLGRQNLSPGIWKP